MPRRCHDFLAQDVDIGFIDRPCDEDVNNRDRDIEAAHSDRIHDRCFLGDVSTSRLQLRLQLANVLMISASTVALGFSAFVLGDSQWTENLVETMVRTDPRLHRLP